LIGVTLAVTTTRTASPLPHGPTDGPHYTVRTRRRRPNLARPPLNCVQPSPARPPRRPGPRSTRHPLLGTNCCGGRKVARPARNGVNGVKPCASTAPERSRSPPAISQRWRERNWGSPGRRPFGFGPDFARREAVRRPDWNVLGTVPDRLYRNRLRVRQSRWRRERDSNPASSQAKANKHNGLSSLAQVRSNR
jgi:hypothetical protein